MKIAPLPANERERLKALNEYFILDTLPEDDFDDITALAAEICGTPISLVSIIDSDRQWFKSRHGLKISETSRDNAFCAHAISSSKKPLVVSDLTKDVRFCDNPLVTGKQHIAFYAGVPLVNPAGHALGTLCVLDTKPRKLTTHQLKLLQSLAKQVVSLLELRKTTKQLKQKSSELIGSYADLEKIAHIASHDLKSPLNNIISLTHLLNDDYGEKLSEEGNEYLTFMNEASYRLSDLVSGIVSYMRAAQIPVEPKEHFSVSGLIEEVAASLSKPPNATVQFKKDRSTVYAPRPVIKNILTQLMLNAVQHNLGKKIKVEVKFHENEQSYTFEVKDNGPGIAKEDRKKMFDLFERLHNKIKDGESMGLGLPKVKRWVEKAGGELKVDSAVNKGSTFIFTIPK